MSPRTSSGRTPPHPSRPTRSPSPSPHRDGGHPVSSSRRSQPLPPNWARTRRRVLRDHAGLCHVCGKPGADEVDHVVPASQGGTDAMDNLAPIHKNPCHLRKTAREARSARPSRRRTSTEEHPGATRTPPDGGGGPPPT